MLSEYRQRFIDYNFIISEDDYLLHRVSPAGRRRGGGSRERLALFRDQRDLFTLEWIEGFRRAESETTGREKGSHRRMLVFAVGGHLASAAHEIEVEIDRLSTDSGMDSDPTPIDDLLAARLERMDRAAQDLGYRGLFHLRRELDRLDYDSLARTGWRLLERTERAAFRSLERIEWRQPGRGLADATREDLAGWSRLPKGEVNLRSESRLARYTALFAGLGFRTDQQRGVEFFETAVRPGGRSGPGEWPDDLMVWPLRIPGEIRAALLPLDGRYGERVFWQTVGATQMAAWTSVDLMAEYRHQTGPADSALPLAWGMLFERLLQEEGWLAGCFGYADTGHFREEMVAWRRLEIRQAAAQLIFEAEYLRGELGGRAVERYRELLGAALLVGVDPSDYRRSVGRIRGFALCPVVSPVGTSPLAATSLLRAAAFESQCHEYLRSRFGTSWWESRRSGEMLIDVWNTGYLHTPEELAPMIGLGPLDYDWLIGELAREVNVE